MGVFYKFSESFQESLSTKDIPTASSESCLKMLTESFKKPMTDFFQVKALHANENSGPLTVSLTTLLISFLVLRE